MGKNKKDYQVDGMESYRYSSNSSDSSSSSSSSVSGSSDSEDSTNSERERKRKRVKKKSSKLKKEKRIKKTTSGVSDDEETEYDDREKRKRLKHSKHKGETDEKYTDNYDTRDDRKHRSSRKHKHHRKHKHKHRHHRHHRSEEQQERRREGSVDKTEIRRGRDGEERKYKDRLEYEKSDRERRMERDTDRKDKREERKQKERYESRQIKSKWDEEEDTQYDANKRIKVESDMDEDNGRDQTSRRSDDDHRPHKIRKDTQRDRQETDGDQMSENGRPAWGTRNNIKKENLTSEEEKQKPNLGLSGKLAEDANTFNGVVIKYSQPPEARKPKRRWRWYIFKGEEDLPFLPLHRQSAYLIGRDRKVADIPTDHPSCSKQHAVLQYRLVSYNREDGTKGRTVKPYILDLESANGTYVNNRRIDSRRFVELLEKDVVKFGYSSREYILLHEGSRGDDENDPDMGVELSPVSLLRSK
ncbi:uncharacterized protein [Procambarus clarkii]|nr:FHA domain-containing protein DDL-like [Procambarus clarkii]